MRSIMKVAAITVTSNLRDHHRGIDDRSQPRKSYGTRPPPGVPRLVFGDVGQISAEEEIKDAMDELFEYFLLTF